MPSHFVLKKQRLADGSIKKYKARLVADGNRQREWTYDLISSPTAKQASVKITFAMAAINGYHTYMYDVKSAYLHADLDKDLYLLLPAFTGPSKLVKLHKALYGLKQSGKLWNDLITKTLTDIGFIQLEADKCMFIRKSEFEDTTIALHVDDLLIATNKPEYAAELKRNLEEKFGIIEDVSESQTHLGIHIERLENGSIKLSQPGYVDHICSVLDYQHEKETHTPLPVSLQLNCQSTSVDITAFRQILGLLNHLVIHTRPDIIYRMSILAAHTAHPTQ